MTYYNIEQIQDKLSFQRDLTNLILSKRNVSQPIVLLCIGTDRATGDCLGPIVGTSLMINSMNATVYGSLLTPVHANNLKTVIKEIYTQFDNPFIIAIDACLGIPEHIGHITLSSNRLSPGESIQQNLPSIGDISITGIVNQASHSNFLILQSTRLHKVMLLANVISSTLSITLQSLQSISVSERSA